MPCGLRKSMEVLAPNQNPVFTGGSTVLGATKIHIRWSPTEMTTAVFCKNRKGSNMPELNNGQLLLRTCPTVRPTRTFFRLSVEVPSSIFSSVTTSAVPVYRSSKAARHRIL